MLCECKWEFFNKALYSQNCCEKVRFQTSSKHRIFAAMIFQPRSRMINIRTAKQFIFYTILLFTGNLFAQDQIDWATLADVKFSSVFSEELGFSYDEASFGPFISLFSEKEVKITGYMIPLDGIGVSYVLSRNPNATCFFCGGAGPETVVELELLPSAIGKYKLDEYRTFKGILHLNKKNIDHLTYVLKNAEPL